MLFNVFFLGRLLSAKHSRNGTGSVCIKELPSVKPRKLTSVYGKLTDVTPFTMRKLFDACRRSPPLKFLQHYIGNSFRHPGHHFMKTLSFLSLFFLTHPSNTLATLFQKKRLKPRHAKTRTVLRRNPDPHSSRTSQHSSRLKTSKTASPAKLPRKLSSMSKALNGRCIFL